MAEFRNDINPPPKFDKDEDDELHIGYVGAAQMPGKILSYCGRK